MKRIFLVLIVLVSVLSFTGCYDHQETSDEALAAKTETSMRESDAQLGIPNILNYTEKKELKNIYELRDQTNLIMYCYLFAANAGKLIYLGKCLGYGIPYATQYSNPQKMSEFDVRGGYNNELTAQAEPNGLFMPSEAHATWVLLLDKQGKPHPLYVEPDVIVSPFELDIAQ